MTVPPVLFWTALATMVAAYPIAIIVLLIKARRRPTQRPVDPTVPD